MSAAPKRGARRAGSGANAGQTSLPFDLGAAAPSDPAERQRPPTETVERTLAPIVEPAADAPRPTLADAEARQRIRHDLDTTLVVEAAAGTGKTTELIERILAVLRSGRARLDGIVALTFTEVAAGEMKLRLRTEIERARHDAASTAEERARLTEALPLLEETRIGTIHAFCADLLRERPVEAGVDPQFEIAPGDAAAQILDRAFERWFESQLASPGPGVRRILRRRPTRRYSPDGQDDGPRQMLRRAANDLIDRRDFPAPWRSIEGFDRDAQIDALLVEITDLGAHAARGPDASFTRSLAEIARFADEARRAEANRPRDYDGLEGLLFRFPAGYHWEWSGGRGTKDFPKQELMERRAALQARAKEFVKWSGADIAPLLRGDLWPLVDDYERLKAQAGRLDFTDLLIRSRDLVRDRPDVRAALQRRFSHFYIDEFQDTDPLQAEILLLLAADDPAEGDWRRARIVPGKLFIVGDPKQSIYRFRRADVALYEAVKRQVLDAGGALVDLSSSFRAVPEIQQAVNAAFAPRMQSAHPSQPRYVALSPVRESCATQPAVVALPVPKPYSTYTWTPRVTLKAIDASLPDTVAAYVHWLVRDSGWTVTERERPRVRVPIQPRHVCLLFKRFRAMFDDVTRPYVIALENRRIPHLLVGGSSFHAREEVEMLRVALGAIERPDDELAVFATLHGPLFALGDDALLAWREAVGSLHPFRRPPDEMTEGLAEVATSLAVLRDLHRGRNRRPSADTLARILAVTRAHASIATWPTGDQALANVTRLVDLARRAERSGTISFRSFVEWLEEQAGRGEAGDAPIFEEGTEGVRIMTVHRAKGLEFPVVILADLTSPETWQEPGRWVDPERGLCAMRIANCSPLELLENGDEELAREREEALRLLYVAATRARDLLVVPAVAAERQRTWLAALDPAIYPARGRGARPESREAPGCPGFGEDAVAARPSGVQTFDAVSPGLHRPEAGEHSVVWWDPNALTLDVEEAVGLAQERMLEADEGGTRSSESMRAHDAWHENRARLRADASVPVLRVTSATAFVDAEVEDATAQEAAGAKGEPSPPAPLASPAATVTLETVANERDRTHGVRFGTLVHALLATIALDANAETVAAQASLQARVLGANDAEASNAAAAVTAALAHPLLRRAAEAARTGRCRRETPILRRLADGTLLECVADLAFVERDDTDWTVVDFKTDADLAPRLDRYRRQVALYADGIAEATGRPARAVLLRV